MSQSPWQRRIPRMCHKTRPRIQLLSLIFCPSPAKQWPQQVERRPSDVGFQTRARTLLLVSLECAWRSARCRCKGTRASVASSVSLSLIRLALSPSRRAASRFLNRPRSQRSLTMYIVIHTRPKSKLSPLPRLERTFTALWVVELDNKTQESVCSRDACSARS